MRYNWYTAAEVLSRNYVVLLLYLQTLESHSKGYVVLLHVASAHSATVCFSDHSTFCVIIGHYAPYADQIRSTLPNEEVKNRV